MSMRVTKLEPRQFVLTSLAKVTDNPLDALMADVSKRRGSAVYREAMARFNSLGRNLSRHLTSGTQTRDQKFQKLPLGGTAPRRACDWAVHSVVALAILVRFDLYIQHALWRRNYHRSHYAPTGEDLLEAIRACVRSRDDDGLVDLIASEAACFLHFVEHPDALAASIRDRLDDFKRL